jgi:hypothetical protein
MKKLQKLGSALLLTFALALVAFAGQTPTPPCVNPGQVDTPPCVMAALGDLDTPAVALTAPSHLGRSRVASSETWFAEIAADLFLNFLPLY